MSNNVAIVVSLLLLGAQAMPLRSASAVIQGSKGNITNSAASNRKLQCGVTTQVNAHTDKYELCPTDCPYFAQNRDDTRTCTFLCVPAQDCKKWNPNKPLADVIKKSRTCRGPMAAFCSEPALDGTDTCIKCQSGFALNLTDGQCYFSYWNTIFIISAILIIVVTVAVAWFVDLCLRKTNNEEEVEKSLRFRSRSKILQPKNADGHRHTYPFFTNLCEEPVAGPGMILHFNFQAFLIVWPLVIAVLWCILACFHEELWVLGTKKFGTPRHNCILVAWGYETQQRLMWTKVLFLVVVYIFSFVSFLLFSVRQKRIYQDHEAKDVSMKKFALELSGLPELSGPSVEDNLKKAVEAAIQKPGSVVGVSVAWKYDDDKLGAEAITDAVKKDQQDRQKEREQSGETPRTPVVDPTTEMPGWRTKMYNWEKAVLGPDEDKEELTDEDMKKALLDMVTSDTAFVVFKTSDDVEHAMEITQDGSVALSVDSEDPEMHRKEFELTLSRVEVDPPVVNWENFGDSSPAAMTGRFWGGFFKIYVPALLVWFFVFYVPYALSLYNFNYDNGAELPGYYSLIFTVVVVGGNATMYVVCDLCCDEIGFRYKDTKACVYMLMYLFACMVNVFLDMIVTYYTALKIMIGLGFRTYDGTRLEDIDGFNQQFETYAMQRSLGGNTYAYAFPSTFLIPFLIEPIVTVLVPYQLGRLIIRTHNEVKGECAEAYIAAFEFDLGRYADILLNVFLGILIFYFPGGYTWTLFYGMCISHIVIYLFDHWRVLKVIPSVKITSYAPDFWAQAMLGGCCALILSALVFKTNCASGVELYCVGDAALISATMVAGLAHFALHMVLLIYLVPRLAGEQKKDENNHKYEDLAKDEAYSWFSVNPVHCLRSKFVHKCTPYCRFVSAGKEHLLEENPAIGCYFSDDPAVSEDYSFDLGKELSSALSSCGGSTKDS